MITFNIKQSPPTAEQIVAVRQHYAARLQVIAKREQQVKLSAVAACLIGASILIGLWLSGYITGVAFFRFVCTMVIMFLAMAVLVIVSTLLSVTKTAGLVAVVFSSVGLAILWGMASAVGFSVAMAVFVIAAFLANRFAISHTAATTGMAELVDLEYSDKQDECIQFDAWRDQDETVKRYSNALVAINRKPVIAEFKLAKEWIEGKDQRMTQREKEKLARAACERMTQAV